MRSEGHLFHQAVSKSTFFKMIFVFCFLCILPLISTSFVDYKENDVSSMFYNMPDSDSIVVPLLRKVKRHKRSTEDQHELHFRAYGKAFNLYFEPDDHVLLGSKTPILFASGDPLNQYIDYKDYNHVKAKLNFRTLIDTNNKAAAIEFRARNNSKHLEGVIGSDYVFSTLTNRTDFNNIRVYKIPLSEKNDVYTKFNQSIRFINETAPKNNDPDIIGQFEKTERLVPDVVYPEILVVADHTMFLHYGKNILNIVKYLIGFWTAVDLRYRELDSPKVRLNIAGIIIADNKNATPYMVYMAGSEGSYLIDDTIDVMSEDTTIPRIPNLSYDIIMTMTRETIYKIDYLSGGEVDIRPIEGSASFGMACNKANFHYTDYTTNTSKLLQQTISLGLVRDYGFYTGSFTAVHELAHMFHVEHDDDESAEEFTNCSADDGFIMNPGGTRLQSDVEANRSFFSNCSKAAIRTFLREGDSQCLYNKPDVGLMVYKPLVGLAISLTEQCQEIYGVTARGERLNNKACEVLICSVFNEEAHRRVMVTVNEPPAEGTWCFPGKICLNGKCEKIPDYIYEENLYNIYINKNKT